MANFQNGNYEKLVEQITDLVLSKLDGGTDDHYPSFCSADVRRIVDAGASRISLSTKANTRADKFYERLGWRRGEIKSNNGEVCYTLDRPEEA